VRHHSLPDVVAQDSAILGETLYETSRQAGPNNSATQLGTVHFTPNTNGPTILGSTTEIHFNARADQNRTVRIDVSSPNNSQENQGICLGWDVPLSTTPKAIVVKLANAAIPSWAQARSNPPHDDPSQVFANARGLIARPQTVGVGLTGFYGPSGSDTGFVELDDVQFVSTSTTSQ